MIRGVTYSNGRVKSIDLKSFKKSDGVSWLHCSEVSLKELEDISNKFHVRMSELKHCLDTKERPRVSDSYSYSLIIFRDILENSVTKRVTYPIEFIVGKNYLITLSSEKCNAIDDIYEEFDGILGKKISEEGISFLIFKIILSLIRNYGNYLENADDIVDGLEDLALHADDKGMQSLFNLKRKILYLRRSLLSNKEVLISIEEEKLRFVKPGDFFGELHIELNQVIGIEEVIRDRMTTIAEIFLSSTSNNLNQAMKSFTVIASLLLVPMLVSGIYGMNVVLPFGEHPKAFSIIIGIMAFSSIIMILYFRAKKWI